MKIKDFTPCPDVIVQELGPYAGLIYGMIYRYSQKYGYCTASQETISKKLGINRSTVNKHIQALVNHDPPYVEDLDKDILNRPHRFRPLKNFSFYVGFGGVEETDTYDESGVGETNTSNEKGVEETDTGVDQTDSTVGETNTGVGETDAIKEFKKEFKKEKEENLVSSLFEKAKQSWKYVLGQLQYEMAKATFDTWVRSTECVAFEDGTFIIGVENAYARDWLESRLTSTVTGLLAGMMDQTVEVRFVVWQEQREVVPV